MSITYLIAIGVLLGTVLFLYHEVRRFPGPAQWGKTPKWPKRIRVALAIIPLLLSLLICWSMLEPARLVTKEKAIKIENWPVELRGLKIAVLSDLHVGGWFI